LSLVERFIFNRLPLAGIKVSSQLANYDGLSSILV